MAIRHPLTLMSSLALSAALAFNVAAAGEATPAAGESAAGMKALLRGIEGMTRLPVNGVRLVQAGGRLLLVSANGRYVFPGPAWDLWHGARLDSLDQATRLAASIDRKRLGLDAAVGRHRYGHGAKEVVIFIDPRSAHCRALLGKLPDLGTRDRFRLVSIPVMGPESEAAVARLTCLAARDTAAARERLLSGDVDHLPVPGADCNGAPAERALVTAELLGVSVVPYLIAPDGRLQQGAPADLVGWLEETP
jgi:thiol:disulfide interchange protein DsbC